MAIAGKLHGITAVSFCRIQALQDSCLSTADRPRTHADEPRRSGRSTKGQHTKAFEEEAAASTKQRKGSKSQSKSVKSNESAEPSGAETDDDENIRCVCGHYDPDEEGRDMICCDNCGVWQHNDCMQLGSDVPDQYFCEQCQPDQHKALLAQIAKGEKPWEEVEKKRLAAEEEKKKKKKGGKKGRKGGARTSDVKSELGDEPTKAESPEGSPVDSKNGPRAGSQKRKLEEMEASGVSSYNSPLPLNSFLTSKQKSKVRKVSAQFEELKPDETLSGVRKNVAGALVSLFTDQAKLASSQRAFKITSGKTAQDIGNSLGGAVEHAMYQNLCGGAGDPNETYKSKVRTILYNVKQNTALRDRLLKGSLSPDEFSIMSTEDMASEELQQRDAEIKREAEKQHTLIQEDGPRIRRTHKGEEIVDNNDQDVGAESVFGAIPRRRESAIDENGPLSPAMTTPALAQTERENWSGSPDPDKPRFGSIDHHNNIIERGARGKIQADAEIDRLLKDEENESPPYSPKDFGADDMIWYGEVAMPSVTTFMAPAKHVAGADLSAIIPWTRLLPTKLEVDGRIDIGRAKDYICGLRFSQTTEVSVASITSPDSTSQRDGFNKLFDYFVQRKRYGVLRIPSELTLVRDLYLVPVEAGAKKHPDFLDLLDNNTVEEPTPSRLFLIVLIIKKSPSTHGTPMHQDMQSPMTAGPTPIVHTAQSPTQHGFQGNALSPSPAQQLGSVETSLIGPKAAEYVLGNSVNAPSIQQLLPKMASANVAEFRIISDILLQVPAARESVEILMAALQERTQK